MPSCVLLCAEKALQLEGIALSRVMLYVLYVTTALS